MNIAQGRLDYGPPVAVIDIGSNSVRLVVYEGLTRSPTPIFNEKVLAGLGREVQTTGLLAADAVDKALAALRRFRALCERMEVAQLWAIATAACREAKNGKTFVTEAEASCGTKIDILSGKREAELSALGVVSGSSNRAPQPPPESPHPPKPAAKPRRSSPRAGDAAAPRRAPSSPRRN